VRFIYRKLFVVLFFLWGTAAAQQDQAQVFVLNKSGLPEDSPGRKILSLLALGNNKDLSRTEVSVEYEINTSIKLLGSGKVQIEARPLIISIKGDNEYRGFSVDSLLQASAYAVKLELIKAGKIIYSGKISMGNNGLLTILKTKQRIFSDAGLVVDAEIAGVEYSQNDYHKFNDLVKLVNDYYGYSRILGTLNEKFVKQGRASKQGASGVFISWQEASRLGVILGKLDFEDNLHLSKLDPEGFKQKYSAFKRLEKRWSTLSRQTLERELKRGFLEDKSLYVKKLIGVSENYYQESLKLQPYMVSAYRQMIVLDNMSDLRIINFISDYYDAYAYGENIIVPQLLYKGFVELANIYFLKSRNIMALALLKNAKLLQTRFDLQESELYTKTAYSTLNGMIESFLKVSDKALQSGKLKFAQNYYREAEEVYRKNKDMFVETGIAVSPFSIYVEAQKRRIKVLLGQKSFYEADLLIKNAMDISDEKNLEKDDELDRFKVLACNGIYRLKIEDISSKMKTSNLDDSYSQLFDLKKYIAGNPDIIYDKQELDEISYSVFLEFLQNGEILLDKGNNEQAFDNLLKAKNIQSEILTYEVERLNILLRAYSEPKILSILEEARLETWAKHGDRAAALLKDAEDLQAKYLQQDNPVIKRAMRELIGKMQGRHCLDAEFRLNEYNNDIVLKIRSGQFDVAVERIKSSYVLMEDNSDCKLDSYKTDSLVDKYGYLLDFYQEYSSMKNQLFSGNYFDAIDKYLLLRSEYVSRNIGMYNFSLPSLRKFVKQQKLKSLTVSSIEYFIAKDQFLLAFEYLQILNSQGETASESKDIQIKLARAMKSSEGFDIDSVNEMISDQGIRQEWYKYFSREVNRKSLNFDFKFKYKKVYE